MKLKVFTTLGVVAALILPFGITSANAEIATTAVSPVQDTAIVASSDAVIVEDSPVVTTVAAPAPAPVVETVAPVTVPVIPDTTVSEPAPVTVPAPVAAPASTTVVTPVTAPVTTTTQATTAPVVAAQTVVQAPVVIAENPLCTEKYLFTVTAAGDCAAVPVGFTVAQLREDAKFELNSRNPLATAEQSTLDAFEANYLGSGSRDKPGVHILHSASIPGVVYYFGG